MLVMNATENQNTTVQEKINAKSVAQKSSNASNLEGNQAVDYWKDIPRELLPLKVGRKAKNKWVNKVWNKRGGILIKRI